ncbi:MAG: G5 domain-containing protein [Firmicutes bacterium]|nr:G5 domain-containing protein [Bacillota bacterium]
MDQNSTLVEERRFSFVWTAFTGLLLGVVLAVGAYYLQVKEVTLTVDGVSFAHRTRAKRVVGVLAELQIPLTGQMRVEPALTERLQKGTQIRISKTQVPPKTQAEPVAQEPKFKVEYITEEIVLPYEVIKKPSSDLLRGTEKIVTQGKEGKFQRTRKLVYHQDELVAEYLVVEKVVAEPQDQVVLVGTREPVKTVATSSGTYRYQEVKDMLATAYYPGPESTAPYDDGYTAIGLKAGYGIVAVDPRVIPLRSKLYIPGYGMAIAGDVGAAIKGNRVDLCYETREEALQFGRRWVKVYILE